MAKIPRLTGLPSILNTSQSIVGLVLQGLAVELGNIIENGQSKEATIQGDLTRLYSKFNSSVQ
jgi:hypothetical protein